MNAQNIEDSSEIISIGLVWLEEDKLGDFLKQPAKTEKMRHDSIETVANKIGGTLVYKIKDVTKLGS